MSKRLEKSEVSAEIASEIADEMKAAIGIAAGPRTWDDTRERWLWRAAQRLGIDQRRAKSFWYREARQITATEYLTVKQRIAALQTRIAESEARNAETRSTIRRARIALAGGAGRAQREQAQPVGERNRTTGGED